EAESDRFMMQEALRYIREHPRHYLQLTWRRLGYYVWFVPYHALAQNIVYRLSWIAVLVLGGIGLIRAIRRRVLDPAIPATFLAFLLLYVPIIVLPRYRIISVVLMLLLAAYSMSEISNRWRLFGGIGEDYRERT
ncbi:MAG: hypothetical protein PHI18_10720, partial [bacterium]|nr:hypothetical protein [bacterium]